MAIETRLVLDADGNIINRIVFDTEGTYPATNLAPSGVDGAIGGTYIDGVYTAPPEPEDDE